MQAFAEILRENGMQYSRIADADFIQEIEDFWQQLVEENGGYVMDSEVDAVLEGYQNIGVIEPAGASSEDPPAEEGNKDRRKDDSGAGNSGDHPEKGGRESAEPEAALHGVGQPQYRIMYSSSGVSDRNHPMLILEDARGTLAPQESGAFTNPDRQDAFERLQSPEEPRRILAVDSRFCKLIRWLGRGHVSLRLSGQPISEGYAVCQMKAMDPHGRASLASMSNSFLQLIIRRLLASDPVFLSAEEEPEEEETSLMLSDMQGMRDFMDTAGDTLPPNIRAWAHRNFALTESKTISSDEKRHAQRALSMMLNIQWESSWFPSIDPVQARRILDEELYGMERVKQRVIETIIQINRTHTLPGYGLLLVGPAGTGKSQIAYAIARILKLPWFALDMSTIHDAEALTGSPRVYTNAKPGRIMEAFSSAGTSNLVFIINELDKAENGNGYSSPADTLLTLLDGLGFTDNYIECTIPTRGVYPIATANDKNRISDPLLSRFAVIDIPDYNREERKVIFRDYVMPKVTARLGMNQEECVITPDGIEAIVQKYGDLPGVRNLEQAGEHIAANALYRIETEHLPKVIYGRSAIEELLDE